MLKDATVNHSKTAQGYALCNRLFAAEKAIADLTTDEREKQRQLKSKPILGEYWSWLDSICDPQGKLKDAMTYSRNQKQFLCTFLTHTDIEFSKNKVENAICPFVIGRKGWLVDTPQGAKASAILYSVMETAKANGLNIEQYILHLLTVLPDRFAADDLFIDDLLSWSDDMRVLFALDTLDC